MLGYVRTRQDGTLERLYGWTSPIEVPADQHTHRGLSYNHVANSSRIEDQLDTLCQLYLEAYTQERKAERNREELVE